MQTIINFRMAEGCEDLKPEKAHVDDAAYDLRSREDCILPARSFIMVRTGVFLELPNGWEAQIRPRSGLAYKYGVTVLNSPGTIDAGYRGEIGVILQNVSDQNFTIERGHRIAQMVLQQLSSAILQLSNSINEETQRGAGGFGSTGRQ